MFSIFHDHYGGFNIMFENHEIGRVTIPVINVFSQNFYLRAPLNMQHSSSYSFENFLRIIKSRAPLLDVNGLDNHIFFIIINRFIFICVYTIYTYIYFYVFVIQK